MKQFLFLFSLPFIAISTSCLSNQDQIQLTLQNTEDKLSQQVEISEVLSDLYADLQKQIYQIEKDNNKYTSELNRKIVNLETISNYTSTPTFTPTLTPVPTASPTPVPTFHHLYISNRQINNLHNQTSLLILKILLGLFDLYRYYLYRYS